MQKRNLISKTWLKYTDRPAYKIYKSELLRRKREIFFKQSLDAGAQNLINLSIRNAGSLSEINALHSGNAGDIIYALPSLRKIHEQNGADINLYLQLNQPLTLPSHLTHPLGNVMLNQKMVDMLLPLLSRQKFLNKVEVYDGEIIDVNLDAFRFNLFPTDKGNIARWCGYITGVSPDLARPWLEVSADNSYRNTIIIARSERYRNILLDHNFLNQYKDLAFIGVDSEYADMKKKLPDLKRIHLKDFEEMASAIAGCKLFIGNQSFPYAVAEALKVPRLLEISFEVINVVPEGLNGHDYLFQEHFELLVKQMAG